ncbi:MAG: hypothetical protein QXH80_00735 [Candidatus Nanoarchaeia archaeon]
MRKASMDLFLEIVLSSVIFFIIVIILFAVRIPQQELKASAHVVSADAALACEMSLTNILSAKSSQGIQYSDWLMNSFIARNQTKLDAWGSEIKKVLDKTFSEGGWSLNVTQPNGTSVVSVGKITKGLDEDLFSCEFFVPFQAAYSQFYCFWSNAKNGTDSQTLSFDTPDGNVKCTIIANGQYLGLKDEDDCKLKLEPQGLFGEVPESRIEDNPDIMDDLVLPMSINNIPYEAFVQQTEKNTGGKISVAISKRAFIEDCSLGVLLQTTNTSGAETLVGVKTSKVT